MNILKMIYTVKLLINQLLMFKLFKAFLISGVITSLNFFKEDIFKLINVYDGLYLFLVSWALVFVGFVIRFYFSGRDYEHFENINYSGKDTQLISFDSAYINGGKFLSVFRVRFENNYVDAPSVEVLDFDSGVPNYFFNSPGATYVDHLGFRLEFSSVLSDLNSTYLKKCEADKVSAINSFNLKIVGKKSSDHYLVAFISWLRNKRKTKIGQYL